VINDFTYWEDSWNGEGEEEEKGRRRRGTILRSEARRV